MADPPSTISRARALYRQGDLAAAAAHCAAALRRQPRNFDAAYLLGLIRASEGRIEEALDCFDTAVSLDPRSFEAWRNLGVAQALLERRPAAITSFERALALRPADPATLTDLGTALAQTRRPEAALASFQKALASRPDDPDTLNNIGAVLMEMSRHEAAVASFEKALALRPGDADGHNNLANALRHLGRGEAAVARYQQALALAPRHAEAHNGLGIALAQLNRYAAAAASFERAIALRPDYAEALSNLGNALRHLRRYDAAIARLQRALAIKPGDAGAHANLAKVWRVLQQDEKAIASLDRALAIDPDHPGALSLRVYLQQRNGDWSDLERHRDALVAQLGAGTGLPAPFAFLALVDDPAAQLACARRWSSKIPRFPPLVGARRPGSARLRLAYLSADFHDHATARLMAELFERHDRTRFEVMAFSHGADDSSPMRRRLVAAFDRFVDVQQESDDDVARRIASEEIDILVDLKGHTDGNRLDILARRPAPVQVHYLGYPGTLGADFIDYLIADRFVAPPEQRANFSEMLVYLSDCYQINDRQRAIAAHLPSRGDCGLPERGVVFCSFNSSYKIAPPVFDVWMRLLRAVPGSALWLLADNPWAEANLRRQAAARGVAPARLVFAPRLPVGEHLARHALADLCLDTLPVNAHTTASDALWSGLPLVTCAGKSFVARVAGSLLHAVGLAELVTDSLESYERCALALAQQPAALATIRRKLDGARDAAALFDSDRTRRQLEAAFLGMRDIHRRGEKPRSFGVNADLSISATG
jgi:protein O-GlcNAc transferase